MRVDFPEIQEEDPPKPKHEFRIRFVAEVVVDEYDIWGDFIGDVPDFPSKIDTKKVVEHLKGRFDNANALLELLVGTYSEELKTTVDVSIEEGSKIVELVETPSDNT